MSDSCSGSNPFKQISDHVNRDNSLHQDRFRENTASRAAGFRSQQQLNGQNEHEFNAFMNEGPQLPVEHAAVHLEGHAAAFLEPIDQSHQSLQSHQSPHVTPGILTNHQASMPAGPASALDVGGSNWVADFHAFNARQQVAIPQAGQPAMQHPQPRFMAQQPFMMSRPNMHNFMPGPPSQITVNHEAPAPQQAQNNLIFAPLYDQTNRGMDPQSAAIIRDDADDEFNQEMDAWMRANGANGFSAQDIAGVDAELAAFAREIGEDHIPADRPIEDTNAIMTNIADRLDASVRGAEDAAARRDETIARLTEQLNIQQPEMTLTDLARSELASLSQPEQDTVVASAAVEEATVPAEQPPAVDSDIAVAAGRLLESVQHETAPKWANSQFLQLMRDFRDGTKTIVDNTVQNGTDRGTEGKGAA